MFKLIIRLLKNKIFDWIVVYKFLYENVLTYLRGFLTKC